MIALDYSYKDTDGDHWPDTNLGSNLYYSIEFSEYLSSENETLVEISWEVDEGLESSSEFNSGSEAYIKLKPLKRGTFKVKCFINTSETGENDTVYTQTKTVEMMLKVV